MLPTYKAILRGNRLEWRESGRRYLSTDRPVPVYGTVWDEPLGEVDVSEKGQGARMAAALERMAEIRALIDISDVATWEREAHQEETRKQTRCKPVGRLARRSANPAWRGAQLL